MKNYEVLSENCKICWLKGFRLNGEKHTQVSAYVFNEQNQLLIVKNGKTWTIPGGHPESGETMEQTLAREIMEEACLTLKEQKYLGAVEVVENGETYYQIRYVAKVKDVLPFKQEWEICERKFVDVDNLIDYIKWCNGVTFSAQLQDALSEIKAQGVDGQSNALNEQELLKLTPKELTDLGVCATCLDRKYNGAIYGDCSTMKLYVDEDIECMFVPNPRAKGHMMISTINHYHDMSEAPDEINAKIIKFAKRFMIIIKEIYSCERVYLCTMSDGPMNHYHVQLIPRYSFEERGSKNFVKPRGKYEYEEEKVEKIRKMIKNFAKNQ